MDTDKLAHPPQEQLGAEIVSVSRRTTRRGFLKVIGVTAAVIGGSIAVDEVVHKSPKPQDMLPALPTSAAGPLLSGSFRSVRRGNADTGYAIAYPPGNHRNPLPVLVALHASRASYSSAFSDLHLHKYLAAAVDSGVPPFAIAAVDGGEGTYWHKRLHTDPAGMVLDEFLPLLASLGLDTRRPGFFGWAMGGYGALYLASLLGPQRAACAGALSPAVWQRYSEGEPGAFDGVRDFDANTIFARLPKLAGVPVRVDCGNKDPYVAGSRALLADLEPTPVGGIEAGYSDLGYWLRELPAQLAFVGAHMAAARAQPA